MSDKADIETTISTLKNDFSTGSEEISEIGKSIYLSSHLEQSGLLNYSILYEFHLKGKYPDNESVINICDRQWYDHLLEKSSLDPYIRTI